MGWILRELLYRGRWGGARRGAPEDICILCLDTQVPGMQMRRLRKLVGKRARLNNTVATIFCWVEEAAWKNDSVTLSSGINRRFIRKISFSVNGVGDHSRMRF